MKKADRDKTARDNVIPLPFDKAVEGLLSVPPRQKKKARKKKLNKK